MNAIARDKLLTIIQDGLYVLTLVCDKMEIQEDGTKVFYLNGIIIAVTSAKNVYVGEYEWGIR